MSVSMRTDPSRSAAVESAPAARPLAGGLLLDGRPLRSPWRLLAAVGAATEAVAHIPVIEEHLSEAPYIGVGFVLLAVAGILLTFLLVSADTAGVWAATALVAALALAGYIVSRTVGLPQIGDDVGNWTEPLGLVALSGEGIMLLSAALHLFTRRRR